jgi:Holliday junction resolvase RusA-like endonuclease
VIGLVERIQLVVHGDPAPQGSKRHVGNGVMIESSAAKVRTWRQDVVQVGLTAGTPMLDEALFVVMVFTAVRPKAHYRTGRNAHLLRDNAPARPIGKPDVSKLARSTEDALTTAGVWRDDARVAEYLRLAKVYAGEDRDALDVPGAVIRIYTLTDGEPA